MFAWKLTMLALTVLVAVPTLAAPKKTPPPVPTVAAKPKAPASPVGKPQEYIEKLHVRLDALVKANAKLDARHAAIAQELDGALDYAEMAKLTLPTAWDGFAPDQRSEFVRLLQKMVQNTYVRRFKPGTPAQVAYGATKTLPNGRFEVATTIVVNKVSADVHYLLLPGDGHWSVYDLVVDEASQVQSYRKNFGKILDKEGYGGLITRMKKAAAKKPT